MHPLSIFIYYARNKRKALPVLGILALAVFGISVSLVLTETIFDGVRAFVSPYYKFIVVEPNFTKKHFQIDPNTRAALIHDSHVAAVLPVETTFVYGPILGIPQDFPVFAVDRDDMNALLAATGTDLKAGRLPAVNADEIVLAESIAKTRGLWVGSQIGSELNNDDGISGKWTVVGIVGGDTVLNLAPLGRVDKGRTASGVLLIPHPGQMDGLVADLNALHTDRVTFQTSAYWNRFIEGVLSQYDALVSSINIVIIGVLSVGVGLLNVIYFRQRIAEFGLLAGIGFSRLFLVRRVTLEALVVTVVAWLLGMGLSLVIYQVLDVLVFEPAGTTLRIFNLRLLFGTLPVPIFVWLFSTLTVVWQISHLDPVTVIDRRD
jgi:hypothetical protein